MEVARRINERPKNDMRIKEIENQWEAERHTHIEKKNKPWIQELAFMYMKNVKSFDIVDFSMHYAYDVPNNAFDRMS